MNSTERAQLHYSSSGQYGNSTPTNWEPKYVLLQRQSDLHRERLLTGENRNIQKNCFHWHGVVGKTSLLNIINNSQHVNISFDLITKVKECTSGFKIVPTTKDEEVCARMNVQEKIVAEPLLQEEGWELFRSRAFRNQNGKVPEEIEQVAMKIAV